MKTPRGAKVIPLKQTNRDLSRHPAGRDAKGKLSPSAYQRLINIAETLVEEYSVCPSCAIAAATVGALEVTLGQKRVVRLHGDCRDRIDKATDDARRGLGSFSGANPWQGSLQ